MIYLKCINCSTKNFAIFDACIKCKTKLPHGVIEVAAEDIIEINRQTSKLAGEVITAKQHKKAMITTSTHEYALAIEEYWKTIRGK